MTGRSATIDRTPPGGDVGGGGGGGWAWVMTARGVIEAELVRGVLETAGVVPVVLDAHDPSPGAWLFLSGNMNALVRVFVPLSMLGEARIALLEAGLADEPVKDTDAGSPNPPKGRGVIAYIVAILAAVVAVLIAFATIGGDGACFVRVIC